VGDETVTHRIVNETPEGFVTKGETQPVDSWRIEQRQIHGEYLGSIPLYGYLLRPLSPQGTGLWGIIAGLVILSIAGRKLLASADDGSHKREDG
jgi:signal peptidase